MPPAIRRDLVLLEDSYAGRRGRREEPRAMRGERARDSVTNTRKARLVGRGFRPTNHRRRRLEHETNQGFGAEKRHRSESGALSPHPPTPPPAPSPLTRPRSLDGTAARSSPPPLPPCTAQRAGSTPTVPTTADKLLRSTPRCSRLCCGNPMDPPPWLQGTPTAPLAQTRNTGTSSRLRRTPLRRAALERTRPPPRRATDPRSSPASTPPKRDR